MCRFYRDENVTTLGIDVREIVDHLIRDSAMAYSMNKSRCHGCFAARIDVKSVYNGAFYKILNYPPGESSTSCDSKVYCPGMQMRNRYNVSSDFEQVFRIITTS